MAKHIAKVAMVVIAVLLSPEIILAENNFSVPLFSAEAVVYTLANAADGVTTIRNIRGGATEEGWPNGEGWVLGKRPTVSRWVIAEGGMEIGICLASWKLQHSRRAWVRGVGHGLMAWKIQAHSMGAVHNIHNMNNWR